MASDRAGDNNNIVELPSKKIEEGSNVRLKSGGPTMTVASVKVIYTCTYFDMASSEFTDHQFYEKEIEIDNRKVN